MQAAVILSSPVIKIDNVCRNGLVKDDILNLALASTYKFFSVRDVKQKELVSQAIITTLQYAYIRNYR